MMTVLVGAETLLLVLVLVLVAGLLRSNAEILRRLGPAADGLPDPPSEPRLAPGVPAPAVNGSTPDGDAIGLAFDGAGSAPTLLAFLTSGCSSCAGFWDTLGEHALAPGVEPLIVTHSSDRERPAKLRSLAPGGIPVVMSSQAWTDYRVPGAPYFVFVDGSVRGEGVATTWQALASLLGDALEDERRAGDGSGRARQIDETFAAAGIGPGHPSLHPGREA